MNAWSWPHGWPAAWAEQLDFAGPRVRTTWWAWAVLAVALMAAMMLAERLDTLALAREDTAAQRQRLERADRQQRIARAAARRQTAPVAAGTPQGQALDAAMVDDALQVAWHLSYPWPQVLMGMEARAAQQQVVLLSLSLDASSPRQAVMQAQGAVQDDLAALQWAASLPQGQLLGRQALQAPFVGSRGAYGLKADVRAVWRHDRLGTTP